MKLSLYHPQKYEKFIQRYSSEDECVKYLLSKRPIEEFLCQKCGQRGAYWKTRKRLYVCSRSSCRKETPVTQGTVMYNSRIPLTTWFKAAYLMTKMKSSMSSRKLQQQLNIGSYRVVLSLRQKLQEQMGKLLIDDLCDIVAMEIESIPLPEEVRTRKGFGLIGVIKFGDIYPRSRRKKILTLIITNGNERKVAEEIVAAEPKYTRIYSNSLRKAIRHQTAVNKDDELELGNVFDDFKKSLRYTHHKIKFSNLRGFLNEICYRYNLDRNRSSMSHPLDLLYITKLN